MRIWVICLYKLAKKKKLRRFPTNYCVIDNDFADDLAALHFPIRDLLFGVVCFAYLLLFSCINFFAFAYTTSLL